MQNNPLQKTKNRTIYEVNLRQYTRSGSITEFTKRLPDLKRLGVGILWIMPIQPIGLKNRKGSMGSAYSISNFTITDPELGTGSDFKQLVEAAHKLDMMVLLDWVANHTAWDHHWTLDNPDFYSKNQYGKFRSPVPEWEDVIHLNYQSKALVKSMTAAMKHWLAKYDIDGFRCDMAHLVPDAFWKHATTELRKVKEIFMLAESERRELLDNGFDMLYNWDMFHVFNRVAAGQANVNDIRDKIDYGLRSFPENKFQMWFTSNHDENSWHRSAQERFGLGLKAFTALTFTFPGMPLIYSGQEAGLNRTIEFFHKDAILWKPDEMFSFYQTLAELKKTQPALWSGNYGGNFIEIQNNNPGNILTFVREKDNKRVFVLLNLSANEQGFTLHGDGFTGHYNDVFESGTYDFYQNHYLQFKPWEYKIYTS